MDAEPTAPPPRQVPRPRRATRVLVDIALALVLLAGWSLLRSLAAPSEPAFRWLTPAQFAQATKPGPFTLLGYRLLNLTGPIWHGFVSLRPQINLSARLYVAALDIQREMPLPGSPFTNPDCARAWLLSAPVAKALREQLKTNSAATPINEANIITSDATRCTLTTGPMPCGLALDVLPKVASGALRLLLAANSTDVTVSGTSAQSRTNLAAFCIAHLQNGGALVLAPAISNDAGGTNLFLIISATAVDARGLPIAPPLQGTESRL